MRRKLGEANQFGGREELLEEIVGLVQNDRIGIDDVALELGDVNASEQGAIRSANVNRHACNSARPNFAVLVTQATG